MPDGPTSLFRELGARTEQLWSVRGYDPEAFPEVAGAVLGENPIPVDPLQLLKLVVRTPGFDNEGTKDAFGQPGIAVFHSPRFQIEVLYWFEGTQRIHQHGFSGAFRVLSGSSVHGRYSFSIAEKVSPDFYIGDTRLEHIELLERGDTRPILPGWRLNHALFHLDHPSTTVVIRTHVQKEYLPQLSLYPPHLAFNEYVEERSLLVRQRALGAAARMDPASLEPLAEEVMAHADPRSLYLLLSHYLGMQRDPTKSAALVDRVRARHGAKVDLYVRVVDVYRRAIRIMTRRAQVRAPEHRFFLALLLNCPTRRAILDLVGRRFPAVDPEATVARWNVELGDLGAEILQPLAAEN
jgi:hypothetical protein